MNRTRRSPHEIVHAEVIADLEKTLAWMKVNLERKVINGEMTGWQKQNKIAKAEYVIKTMREMQIRKQPTLWSNGKK